MKTLSRTFAFKLTGLATVGVLAVLAFPACLKKTPAAAKKFTPMKFTLKIGRTDTEFVDVQSKKQFIEALSKLKEEQYEIDFKDHDRAPVEHYPSLTSLSIKTDKVTTSEVAQNASSGGSAANDPNAVYRVTSNSKAEIKSVLDTFK